MLNSKSPVGTTDEKSTKAELNPSSPNCTKPLLAAGLNKSRKCDWCNKRKLVEQGYWLGKFDTNKNWFICQSCNLKHNVV